jgi:hypothetical protein
VPTGDRQQAAVDALFAEALSAGESRPRAREVVSRVLDEQILASALRRAVPAAFLEEVASARPWSERPRVLARVVLSPRAPKALSLRLVSGLYWRLGDRITLARLATPALLPALLADSEQQVVESALLNPRLREEDLVVALRREDVKVVLVEATASSSRWAANYAVRLTLVLQPRTPLPVALQQISSLVPRDLRRVAGEGGLRPLLRAAAQEVLARANTD